MTRIVSAALAVFIATSAQAATSDRLWSSYRQDDFFALREELPPLTANEPQEIQFLRAASFTAFGNAATSARILTRLLPTNSRATELESREMLMLNLRSLFRYRDALRAVAPLLAGNPASDDPRLRDLRNRAHLLQIIKDVPPQAARPGSGAPMPLDANGRLRVTVNRRTVRMVLDTGANFSVVSRSAARSLGLSVRTANYRIGSLTGGRASADVTIADIAFADGTRVANAIFLVLPDSALTLSDGSSAAGLIGFPVIAGLGAVTFDQENAVSFGSRPYGGAASTELALAGTDPLLRASYRGHAILCRLDTGADRSVFYAPFFAEFRRDVATSRRRSVRIGSATGTISLNAFAMPALDIVLANRSFRLVDATVLTAPIQGAANTDLFCNIGRDILRRLPSYTIDFGRMTLTLED